MNIYFKYFWLLLFIGDSLLLNLSYFLSYYYKFQNFSLEKNYFLLFVSLNLIWIITTFVFNIYKENYEIKFIRTFLNLLKIVVLNFSIIITLIFTLKISHYFSRELIYLTFFLFFLFSFVFSSIILEFFNYYAKKNNQFKNVIIVGNNSSTFSLIKFFNSPKIYSYKLLEVFSDEKLNFSYDSYSRKLNEIKEFCNNNNVDEIYFAMPLDNTLIKDLIEFTDFNFINLKVIPDLSGFSLKSFQLDYYERIPVVSFRNIELSDIRNRFYKRSFDIIFSFLVIVLILSWLYPLIAIIIKITSPGPVLFKQQRSGIDNNTFICYKFRSMQINNESDLLQATKNDSRITTIGKFLRKSSLDEFPQFFNVFFGDMSIVGPRPHMLAHTKQYSLLIKKYMLRHLIKPGITGMAQINGYRGETKKTQEMEGRIRWDVWYIENWSFSLDVYVVYRTIVDVFRGDKKAF